MGTAIMLRSALTRSARSICAASSRGMATEAPMQLHGIDGRYATSLWKVAADAGSLPAVEKDLSSFKSVSSNPAVEQLLGNPSIPRNTKVAAVEALMKKSGYAEPTKNFFALLAENGRLDELMNIIGKFESLQRAAKGELNAEITVADELTAAQKKSLEKSLKKFVETSGGSAAKLSLDIKVKPEILGGLIIDVGDKHINMSILARIQQLQNLLN